MLGKKTALTVNYALMLSDIWPLQINFNKACIVSTDRGAGDETGEGEGIAKHERCIGVCKK